MDHIELLSRGVADLLAQGSQVAGLVGADLETEGLRVHDPEEHPAIGDVQRDGAMALDLQRAVQDGGKGGGVAEGDGSALAVFAIRRHLDHAAGHIQLEAGDRLHHRHLHHDGARSAVGGDRRDDQVDMARDRSARLADQQAADVVVVTLHRDHALHHGGARRGQNAADDDIADLALGMAADHGNRKTRAHGLFLLVVRRRCCI